MKKIFFANSDDGGHIARNARQMMTHLSISIDEDVQQTLSFFEKVSCLLESGLLMGLITAPVFKFVVLMSFHFH